MIVVSSVMCIIATAHLALNQYRCLLAFRGDSIEHTPEFIITRSLNSAHNKAREIAFTSQVLLGSSVALYRTWVVWNQSYRIICLPFILLLAHTAIGFTMVGLFTSEGALAHYDVETWFKAHFTLLVILNLTTTSLIVFRIRSTVHSTSRYFVTSKLAPLPRIFIESAMLQLVAEALALALYTAGSDGFLVVTEAIIPIIGITFNALTIRIKLLSFGKENSGSYPLYVASLARPTAEGSRRSRQFQVDISLSQDVECEVPSRSIFVDRPDLELTTKEVVNITAVKHSHAPTSIARQEDRDR
ncbi:hypothetical protein PM082_006608 [Marasmius tenuissimus]|nr:hypothetical protein PM082_006608 [Marasmius tenuissimus]